MKNKNVQNKKAGQVSVDMIIMMSFLFIIFLIMATIILYRNSELVSSTQKYYAKSLSDQVATEINSVFNAGDGTQKTIILPDQLKDNTAYNINIYPNSRIVEIVWNYGEETRHYSSSIITTQITGDLTNISDDISILNVNGEIDITII
ncbi:MAG: hypothetical protein ABII01_05975 [Candidatus Woesearchaeota archaeon]